MRGLCGVETLPRLDNLIKQPVNGGGLCALGGAVADIIAAHGREETTFNFGDRCRRWLLPVPACHTDYHLVCGEGGSRA